MVVSSYKMCVDRIRTDIGYRFRKWIRNSYERKQLKNTSFSIITNHCMGGIICHDLGLRFSSPTVNLKILPDDFVKFVENLEYYLSLKFVQIFEERIQYPIGKLGDITIYFVHYKTFEEAVNKWDERKKRIQFDNIRIMMTIRDGCSKDTIERFNKLPYRKVMFDNDPHPECNDSVCARRNGQPLSGYISDIYSCFGKRGYQYGGFDYIAFLNGDNKK